MAIYFTRMWTRCGRCELFGTGCSWGRAPRTKETLPDFREWCRVTRHPRVFRRLTGCQRTPGKWGFTYTHAYTYNISYHLNILHISYLLIIPCFISYHFTLFFMFLSQYTCHRIAVLCFSYHTISYHMSYSSNLFYVSCLHKP